MPNALVLPQWHIYLQGAIASMAAGLSGNIAKTSRHDIVLRLTARGEPFIVEIGAYKGPVSAVVTPPLQRHSARNRDISVITYVVHVIHPRFRALRGALDGSTKILDHARFAHLASSMDQACLGQLSVDAACDLMDGLLDVLLEGVPPAPPLDLRIPWVMRRLDVNIDHPFEQLAAELGVSPSRLSHLFSQQLGLSFRSYQAWARLRQAWEMLTQKPELSIADVAATLGFADVAHLSRSFHSSLGFTPSTVRDPRVVHLIGHGMPPGQHIPSDEEMRKP